jgi:hypothetical protein
MGDNIRGGVADEMPGYSYHATSYGSSGNPRGELIVFSK